MGFLKKVFGGIKKHVKKITKGIMKAMKPMGKVIGKVMKPFGKIMNKLGPVGSMALMFILPMALPAIWGSFGTAVANMTGPLGSLLKGVHAVGSAAGNVYSTVTGAITDTIGKIAGNTIGKIPLGAERTVGSTYNDFTGWAARTMEGRHMKMTGQPSDTGLNSAYGKVNETAELVKNAASDIDFSKANFANSEKLMDLNVKGFESNLNLDLAEINPVSNSFVPSSGTTVNTLGNVVDDSFVSVGGNTTLGIDAGAQSLLTRQQPMSDVITGYKQTNVLLNEPPVGPTLAGASTKPYVPKYAVQLEPIKTTIPSNAVSPQMASNTQAAKNYADIVNDYASRGITNQGMSALTQAGKDVTKLVAAEEMISPTPEPVSPAYSRGVASDALALARANDVTTIEAAPMDFAGLSSSYANAGYGSFANPQDQYQAGAYGGGAFNNQVALRMLAPTVALPKI